MFLPAFDSSAEQARTVVTSWRTGPEGSREILLSVAGGTNQQGVGREALVLDTVSPTALPLRWAPPPRTPAWPTCRVTKDEKDTAAGKPLKDPHGTDSGRGSCGHTLWSCDWLSHSVLNLPQKTDPREGDHYSRPSAH